MMRSWRRLSSSTVTKVCIAADRNGRIVGQNRLARRLNHRAGFARGPDLVVHVRREIAQRLQRGEVEAAGDFLPQAVVPRIARHSHDGERLVRIRELVGHVLADRIPGAEVELGERFVHHADGLRRFHILRPDIPPQQDGDAHCGKVPWTGLVEARVQIPRLFRLVALHADLVAGLAAAETDRSTNK